MNLSEAFQTLESLNEDIFSVDEKGLDDLEEFEKEQEEKEDNQIEVIDAEAYDDDELENSYVGKLILDCDVCHSKIFEDPKNVIVDKELGLANVDQECPYCRTTEGYKILGKIENYEQPAETEEEELSEAFDGTSIDLSTKNGTLANDFRKAMPELEKIQDVEELRKKCIEIIKNSSVGEETKRRELAAMTSPKSRQALISSIATIMTGISVGSGSKKKYYEAFEGVRLTGRTLIDLEDALDEYIRSENASGEEKETRTKEFLKKLKEVNADLNVETIEQAAKQKMFEEDSINLAARRFAQDLRAQQCKTLKDFFEKQDEDFSASMNEDFKEVSITTDETKMDMTSDESGKVVVTTQPTVEQESDSKEVVKPLTDEEREEIENSSEKDSLEVDIDEFDEESFDELGESFLTEQYSNVTSYKTTKTFFEKGALLIEGVLTFDSGKRKATSFKFLPSFISASGKMKFVGENLQLSRGKKSFKISGKVEDKKFLSESLNYNYQQKMEDGTTKKIYGTINRGA